MTSKHKKLKIIDTQLTWTDITSTTHHMMQSYTLHNQQLKHILHGYWSVAPYKRMHCIAYDVATHNVVRMHDHKNS